MDSFIKAAKPIEKFSKSGIETLKRYTSKGYININQALNGHMEKEFGKDSELLKYTKDDIRRLDELFENSEIPEPLVTFRGIKDDILVNHRELMDALDTPGSEIQFPSFTSTTAVPYTAIKFAVGYNSRIIELQLPKGTKALYLNKVSMVERKNELLLDRNIKFEVIETKTVDIKRPRKGDIIRQKVTTIRAIL